MKSFNHTSKIRLGLLAILLCLLSARSVRAQIYAVNDIGDGESAIGEYNDNGTTLDSALLGTASYSSAFGAASNVLYQDVPESIAVSGSDLFVLGDNLNQYGSIAGGSIGEYTSSGATINSSLVTLVNGGTAMAVSGSDIFVADAYSGYGVGEYTTSGATVSPNLISLPTSYAISIAVSGTNLFVGLGNGTISEYTTSGVLENASLISGLSYPMGLAVSGSDLFVANGPTTISEYTTSGTLVNSSLIAGLSLPYNITVSGTDLFVGNVGNQQIGEYTTSGATVNASLVTGVSGNSVALGSQTSPPAPVTPTSTPSTVSAGTAYTPLTVTPVTSTGGLGSTVSIVGGTAGGNQTVTLATTNLGGNFTGLASDVVSVSGNAGSIFTLQLTFDLNTANQNGGAAAMTLLWQNPANGQWENAVLGNTGTNTNNSGFLDYQGSFASFEATYDITNANLSLALGAYGVDTTDDTVWAVIDHNSTFAVASQSDLPQAAPEPSTWALLLGGVGLLAFCRVRTSPAFKKQPAA